MATLLRFSFEVFGTTMNEVVEKLDELTQERLTAEGGEPWVVMADQVEKKLIAREITDPASWMYVGQRQVVFAGPTPVDQGPPFHDGFRPQSPLDDLGGL